MREADEEPDLVEVERWPAAEEALELRFEAAEDPVDCADPVPLARNVVCMVWLLLTDALAAELVAALIAMAAVPVPAAEAELALEWADEEADAREAEAPVPEAVSLAMGPLMLTLGVVVNEALEELDDE